MITFIREAAPVVVACVIALLAGLHFQHTLKVLDNPGPCRRCREWLNWRDDDNICVYCAVILQEHGL